MVYNTIMMNICYKFINFNLIFKIKNLVILIMTTYYSNEILTEKIHINFSEINTKDINTKIMTIDYLTQQLNKSINNKTNNVNTSNLLDFD